MPRLTQILSLLVALAMLDQGYVRAQSVPADVTVLSVLTMAKEAAETARGENDRRLLRSRVARSIEATGHAEAFGSYVDDADRDVNRPPSTLERIFLDALARNREIRAEAKKSLLAGDAEKAENLLRQCQWVPHWDPCETHDPFVPWQLLGWEATGRKADAALHRLKSTNWRTEALRRMAAMRVARVLIAAGRRTAGLDVLRMVHEPGRDFDPCIVQDGMTGPGAGIRKLACEGQASAALDLALRMDDIAMRTVALAITAEAMMGIPGYSSEHLEPWR